MSQIQKQVETCKDRIAAALETLRPTTSWERTTGAGQGLDGVLLGGRGFGAAMEALFNYLGSEFGNTFALGMVKSKIYLIVFLFGFYISKETIFVCYFLPSLIICWWGSHLNCTTAFILNFAARVFAFLSGPPDYGAGQLDTRRYGEQYASRGEDADRALLPEQTPFYKQLVMLAWSVAKCCRKYMFSDCKH